MCVLVSVCTAEQVCMQACDSTSVSRCVCACVPACVCVYALDLKGSKFQSEVRAEKRGGRRASTVPAFPECYRHLNPFLLSLLHNLNTTAGSHSLIGHSVCVCVGEAMYVLGKEIDGRMSVIRYYNK